MLTLKEDKKKLLSNFLSLSSLQAVNMLLPLITLPYLVRVLGVETFGLINFSLSIIMYFGIFVSFGFELSATREISMNQDDKNKISEIFSSVILIKIVMLLISLFILSLLIINVKVLNENTMLYYITFGIVIGNSMFPSWLFQGMEKMKYITYINVSVKVLFTIMIFFIVKNEEDFLYVPLLNSLGAIIAGVYSLWLVNRLFKVRFIFPNLQSIIFRLKDSYHFFLSRVANNGSRYYATTIIGIYFGNTVVGYYSMVEKLFYAFMSLGGVVSQTIYPYMSRTKNIVFFKKIFLGIVVFSSIITIALIFYNNLLLLFVFNVENELLTELFIIIFSSSVFGIASALVGYPLLAAYGYIKHANNSLIYASLIYILFITVSAVVFKNIYLVALSIVLNQVIGLGLRFYYIKKEKLI